jgi:hypothetical protein
MQVEGVDIALQQTDLVFSSTVTSSRSLLENVVWAALDVVAYVTQVGLSVAKLFLAAFLLWLVVDLFLLRPLIKTQTRWRAFLDRRN